MSYALSPGLLEAKLRREGCTMRKLKLAIYVSLDGVVENPAWTGPYWNDELSDLQAEHLYSSDALSRMISASPI
jgi:hypothetical protein